MSDEESAKLESLEIKKKAWTPEYVTRATKKPSSLPKSTEKDKKMLKECTIPLKRIVKYYCILSDVLSNNSENIDDNIIENFCKLIGASGASGIKVAKKLIVERDPIAIDLSKSIDYWLFVSNYLTISHNCSGSITRMWCADCLFKMMLLFEKENTRLLFLISKSLVDVHFRKLDEIINTDCVKANASYKLIFENHRENLKRLCSDILLI